MATGNGNIDERLEALTMNLELMSASVEAHDRQLATIMDTIVAHDRQMATVMGSIKAHDRQMGTIIDSIEKLVNVTNEDATAIRTLARLADATRGASRVWKEANPRDAFRHGTPPVERRSQG